MQMLSHFYMFLMYKTNDIYNFLMNNQISFTDAAAQEEPQERHHHRSHQQTPTAAAYGAFYGIDGAPPANNANGPQQQHSADWLPVPPGFSPLFSVKKPNGS